jgi:prevent-host-death family protein
MTMKEATAPRTRSPQRVGVAHAKSRLSEVLRHTADGPTIIHSRGRDLAVLLAIEDYERLVTERPAGQGTGAALLGRIEALKRRRGGGVRDFKPAVMRFRAMDPFSRQHSRSR